MATAMLLRPTVPIDYHRIVSQTLKVPSDTSTSVPVGLLACQRDPLKRSLETVVVTSELLLPQPKAKGKSGKKAVLAPTLPELPILQIVLNDTVIFPEGGGQPTDTGKLALKGADKIWNVIQAKRHGGIAVHYVEIPVGESELAALEAFTPGIQVTVYLDEEDYKRRYDHMSMHTSQHLLSALLETRLNLPTLSWSLTSYPSPCYIEIPRGMKVEEITSIQNEANQLVFEGRRVYIEVDDLDNRDLSQKVPETEAGRAIGKGLPTDYTGGVKRVVIIDGVDRNPCCGTHLPSIHNLQLFLLPHTEALSRGPTTSARLYFLSGLRLIAHLTKSHTLVTQSAALLSCGAPLLPDRLSQVIDDRKKAEKRLGDLEIELAERIGQDIAQELAKSEEQQLFTDYLQRVEDSTNALGFLSAIATAVCTAVAANKLESRRFLVALSSTPSSQTVTSLTTVMLVGSENEDVKKAGDALKAKLGIKGGGKGSRWSGKYTGVWNRGKDGEIVEEVLRQ
ncbi:alanyl-tRNA synthetase domain-containing protein [Coprinopsis marcescibilis]|uniref:Alanyl-tRNA synthetase domain-containing protein n=1 Tax=Coprinopsis marcescibilis TaxID=230819 RepID=A0A5C3L8G0_COPMA|nr:alanyl-tRNA synthetase domain-containing protein [Coprinopsis marcescibilis]